MLLRALLPFGIRKRSLYPFQFLNGSSVFVGTVFASAISERHPDTAPDKVPLTLDVTGYENILENYEYKLIAV